MPIKPTQLSVKLVFEQNHTFQVPKYQRGYAWDEDAIEDFVEDIGRCLKARARATPRKRHHFFGGIVTVMQQVPGSNRINYEVIDGQQRLASFVMLAAAVVKSMRNIVGELAKKQKLSADERRAKKFLEATIKALKSLYIIYHDNVELEYVDVPKLKLSAADDAFFQKIIGGDDPKSERASHERIQDAWSRLCAFVDTAVVGGGTVSQKAKRIQLLVNTVLAEDCTVIFMSSDTRGEAYQIFQVLNDRGVHLTDGDLLRASTMELMDQKELASIQNSLAAHWDKVLGYPSGDIESYLSWYYSSYEGQRPKSVNLAGQFLEHRFRCKDRTVLGKDAAKAVLKEVEQMDADFALLAKMGGGDWPYSDYGQVTGWDRERLRMLVVHLKHTNALPLLLALTLLDQKKFSDALAAIERFVFRYKTIGNGHAGQMTKLYLAHAKKIRDEKSKYSVGALRTDLRTLVFNVVPDSIFETNLKEVRYSPQSGNWHIRYLLITLEDYAAWVESGGQGMPKCKDKTRVFDFSNTTLEHVYPRTAEEGDKDATLEPVKHDLGNLTIFGPGDNDKLANKAFAKKRPSLASSSLRLNREIAANGKWKRTSVEKRTAGLIKTALKVFVP